MQVRCPGRHKFAVKVNQSSGNELIVMVLSACTTYAHNSAVHFFVLINGQHCSISQMVTNQTAATVDG